MVVACPPDHDTVGLGNERWELVLIRQLWLDVAGGSGLCLKRGAPVSDALVVDPGNDGRVVFNGRPNRDAYACQ